MERIVIEVTDETAKKWKSSSQQKRDEIARQLDIRLAKELTTDPKEFMRFLDELGAEMEERGLTEEILQNILKDDE